MYNLKNTKQAQVKIHDKMLGDNVEDHKLSLEGEVPPNYNGLLESQRDPAEAITHEARLDETRDAAIKADHGTNEANMDNNLTLSDRADLGQQFVKPNDVLSEAHDSKAREAILKAESDAMKAGDRIVDKNPGEQMLGDKTKIKGQVPVSGSQLANRPERFNDFSGVPHNKDQQDNIGVHTNENDIKPFSAISKKASKMAMSSLRDADAMLFHIYATASSENRELSKSEQKLIEGISNDKARILSNALKSVQADNIDSQWDRFQDASEWVDDGEGGLELRDDPESVPGVHGPDMMTNEEDHIEPDYIDTGKRGDDLRDQETPF